MNTSEVVSLMECLGDIEDPRKPSNGTLHDLREILVIAICATLSNVDNFDDIAFWARTKEAWLRRFLVLEHGIPSQWTFLRIFGLLDPKQFETVFRRWVNSTVTALSGHVAIDGKTLRGSAAGGEPAVHLVSAFATDLGIALGQEKVVGKSNEITAIPELIEALYLKGHLVSIDAMGCQKDIAARIVKKGGDYLLAVKGNQPGLLQKLDDAVTDQAERMAGHERVDPTHGRLVVQWSRVLPAHGIVDPAVWPKCRMIGVVDSLRKIGDQTSGIERRYYISSRELSAEDFARAVRSHWGIENQLHWMLDVVFGEDGSTVRKDHAPQNFSLLKKIVLNIIRLDQTETTKCSLRKKRLLASWNDDVRMNMLGIWPL